MSRTHFSTMPVHHAGMGPHHHSGGNIFHDAWNGIKKGANYIKDNKLISQGLSLIPHPKAQAAARIAKEVGLGKRKKGRGKRTDLPNMAPRKGGAKKRKVTSRSRSSAARDVAGVAVYQKPFVPPKGTSYGNTPMSSNLGVPLVQGSGHKVAVY